MGHRDHGGRVGGAVGEPLGGLCRATEGFVLALLDHADAPEQVTEDLPDLDGQARDPRWGIELELAEQWRYFGLAGRRNASGGGDGTRKVARGDDMRAVRGLDQLERRTVMLEDSGGVVGALKVSHVSAPDPAAIVDVRGRTVPNEENACRHTDSAG